MNQTLKVVPVTPEDYRRLAEKRLPRFLFDYLDGGANDDELEIIKMSSINFEKTIAGEVDEPEDSITLVLFEGEEKRCEEN